jgi:ABC-type nitrate/sulfonate/bicarbonate transport system substrate-binding protein
VTVVAALMAPPSAFAAPPAAHVAVVVPDAANLQFLAFWVAYGAGYFADEGIDVEVQAPEAPALAQSTFQGEDPPFAVLPAPDFERLIAERFPLELVANLLANDPIDLVVRREVADARGIRADQPLAARLESLRGLTIGMAPNPRTRLVALFRSQGLDADALVRVRTVRGDDQNEALRAGTVDALYTHTPFLERALLDDDAVVVVDQAGGEVAALAGRQIHALVVKREFAEKEPRVVGGMLRAIARAETLVHADAEATTDAILRAVARHDREHVAELVAIYAPAIPRSPEVTAGKITRELAYYPAGGVAPDLSHVALDRFVYRARGGRSRGAPLALVLAAAVVAAILGSLAALRAK